MILKNWRGEILHEPEPDEKIVRVWLITPSCCPNDYGIEVVRGYQDMLERVNMIAEREAEGLIDDAVMHPISINIRLGGARVGDIKHAKNFYDDDIEIFPDPGADPQEEGDTEDNGA